MRFVKKPGWHSEQLALPATAKLPAGHGSHDSRSLEGTSPSAHKSLQVVRAGFT